jgi:hypothetical protein
MFRLSAIALCLATSLACIDGSTPSAPSGGGSNPFVVVANELAACNPGSGSTSSAAGLRIADAYLEQDLSPGGTATLAVALAEVDGTPMNNYPTATVTTRDADLTVNSANAVWLFAIDSCDTQWGSTTVTASPSLNIGDTVQVEISVDRGAHSVMLELPIR